MEENVEDLPIPKSEKLAIEEIERLIGYKFKILEKTEFFCARSTKIYYQLEPNFDWLPIDDKFGGYSDTAELSITIGNGYIIGLSITSSPRIKIYLTKLPESFQNLKHLKYLVLEYQNISNLHHIFEYLPSLEYLSLKSSYLKYQEGIFDNLTNLEGLNLAYYPRDENLLNEICNLTSLTILDLSNVDMNTIPQCFSNLLELKVLKLSYRNNFIEFPRNLGIIKNLEILTINETGISSFPENLDLPSQLKKINIGNNHFTELHPNFEKLEQLNEIRVDSEVVVSYIRKTKEVINKELDKFSQTSKIDELYEFVCQKKKFLELITKNSIDFKSIGNYFPEFRVTEELERNAGRKRAKQIMLEKASISINDDLLEINTIYNNIEYARENQVSIEKLKFYEEYEKNFEFGRLNIFIGKNNSGKTYRLKKIFENVQFYIENNIDVTSDETMYVKSSKKFNLREIEFFYVPKTRVHSKVINSGERKGVNESLNILLKVLQMLKTIQEVWTFDNVIEFINFFNIRQEEVGELDPNLSTFLHLIINQWLKVLRDYFPDIHLDFPLRTDLNTKFQFNCYDEYFPQKQYDFNELGSGMQELLVLIFLIELLKYLPRFTSDLKIGSEISHRILFIDEPDLSLHPELQESFFKYLEISSMRLQIFVTTQSPFIPKPINDYIVVYLFVKDREKGYLNEKVTKNNRVLIRDELFRDNALTTSSFLASKDYRYFRDLDYFAEEFCMGRFIHERYTDAPSYKKLLNLGTKYRDSEEQLLQNAYFLSFSPDVVDLNNGMDEHIPDEIRVFIVQVNKICDKTRYRLTGKFKNKSQEKINSNRYKYLCIDNWDSDFFNNSVLKYGKKEGETNQKILEIINGDILGKTKKGKTIIIFPENSLPYNIIPELLLIAKQHELVILGGMEHFQVKEINNLVENWDSDISTRLVDRIDYTKLITNTIISDTTYINQAIVINSKKGFTFQIKHVPALSGKNIEGTPIVIRPSFRIIKTILGKISVMICKDLLVNFPVVNLWMELFDINILAVPSFTPVVNPFRNKLGEIISDVKNKNRLLLLANIAEYGGSGAYNYVNRGEFEPNRNQLFPADYGVKDERIRPSVPGAKFKDFMLNS